MFRQMDVSAEWVVEGQTGAFPQILGTSLDPEQARELQGTMSFCFPELEIDGIEIFDTPGVVEWLEILHARIPHLAYFLSPDARTGALEGLLRTLLPPDERESARGKGIPLTPEILVRLAPHLVACAAYATAKGDDWEPIVTRFVAPLELREDVHDALIGTVDDSVRAQAGRV